MYKSEAKIAVVTVIETDEVYTKLAGMDGYLHIKSNILESSRKIVTRKWLY